MSNGKLVILGQQQYLRGSVIFTHIQRRAAPRPCLSQRISQPCQPHLITLQAHTHKRQWQGNQYRLVSLAGVKLAFTAGNAQQAALGLSPDHLGLGQGLIELIKISRRRTLRE